LQVANCSSEIRCGLAEWTCKAETTPITRQLAARALGDVHMLDNRGCAGPSRQTEISGHATRRHPNSKCGQCRRALHPTTPEGSDLMQTVTIVFWSAWILILYTYVVFPVLLAAFARFKRRYSGEPAASGTELPRVAMVVAAFNEAHVLAGKLENTWELDYPSDRFQILIGSDGSDDGTEGILSDCHDPRLRKFLYQKRRGKISVLNSVMAEVNADIVVMSDANTMFAPDSLRKLIAHFADPKVGCVSGELRLEQEGGVSGEGLYWKYESWIKRNESRLGFLIGCNGGIFAIRRELYEPLPASTIVEDFVLSMRILERGYRVHFEPAARAVEPPCVSSKAEMVRKIRIGAGGFQALSLTRSLLHPRFGFRAFAFWGHKVLRWLVPVFLGVAIASNVLLIGMPVYPVLLAAQLAGACIAYWAYRSSTTPRWTRPISYFYLMNFALLCGLVRYLKGTQRVTWDRATPASTPPSGLSTAQVFSTVSLALPESVGHGMRYTESSPIHMSLMSEVERGEPSLTAR